MKLTFILIILTIFLAACVPTIPVQTNNPPSNPPNNPPSNPPQNPVVYTTFEGTWDTQKGQLTMYYIGNKIKGVYSMGTNDLSESGSIEGIATGNRLDFKWYDDKYMHVSGYSEDTDQGDGYFILNSGGMTFSGYWKYHNEPDFREQKLWGGTRLP